MNPINNSFLPRNWPARLIGIVFFGVAGFVIGRHSVKPEIIEREGNVTVTQDSAAVSAPVNPVTPVEAGVKMVPDAQLNAWNESRWSDLLSQAGTTARNEKLAALLEKLAVTDPQKAMAMAEAETNLKLRADLVQAVLRGWATAAPMDAATWALALPGEDQRNQSMATILASAAANDPQSGVNTANLISRANPDQAAFYGSSLIQSLCRAGDFQMAAKFAADSDSESRPSRLAEAYADWAKLQPAQAAQAAQGLPDPEMRTEALRGLASGWADVDPAGLAQFVAQLPQTESRGEMLGWALQNWAKVDPGAATDWVNGHFRVLGSDLDQGMQSIATANALYPNVAVNWAESITDPAMRSDALAVILRNWVHSDPTPAEQYFSTTQNLLPADREQISSIIKNTGAPAR